MKYVSVDLETTGLDVDVCQVLEVGLVVDDLGWPDVIGEGPYGGRPFIRQVINNGTVVGEPLALQMNAALLLEIAQGGGVPVDIADCNLFDFLVHHRERPWIQGNPTPIVAAGKNVAGFDLPILRKQGFLRTYGYFHHRKCDPAMLYWQPGDSKPPSLSECLARAGIDEPVEHTACADAWQVIRLLRHKLNQSKDS